VARSAGAFGCNASGTDVIVDTKLRPAFIVIAMTARQIFRVGEIFM
jgi:hypothetical protein